MADALVFDPRNVVDLGCRRGIRKDSGIARRLAGIGACGGAAMEYACDCSKKVFSRRVLGFGIHAASEVRAGYTEIFRV